VNELFFVQTFYDLPGQVAHVFFGKKHECLSDFRIDVSGDLTAAPTKQAMYREPLSRARLPMGAPSANLF
jgi:hypothetical protein